MVMDIRAEIARVSAEHDNLMREDAQWLAHREAEREALMRKSDDEAVLYRTTEQNAQASAAPTDSVPSDGEADDDELDEYSKGIVEFVCMYTAGKLVERDRRIGILEGEIRELKGFIGGLLAMLGADKAKSVGQESTIVDLPDWRRRHA